MTLSYDIPTPALLAQRRMSIPPDDEPSQQGIDPRRIYFTPQLLRHAELVGFTREQMNAALRDPRWVNRVYHQPTPKQQNAPRYRYCGHGVAVIVEGCHAIAVIEDDPSRRAPVEHDQTVR